MYTSDMVLFYYYKKQKFFPALFQSEAQPVTAAASSDAYV